MGQAPATGTNSLRTFPRNFKGRSGTKDDHVYLCSPETAAASALAGHIADPRELGSAPTIELPERFAYRDDWFILPADRPDEIEVLRGPNIKPFPQMEALPNSLEAEVILKVDDNVSTDVIMPAGNRVLPYRSNIPAISSFVFDVLDQSFSERAEAAGPGVVVGGHNYGQGSSREHAALAPRYLGIRVKIAKSFARIHKANLMNFGIIPLVFENEDDYEKVEQGMKLTFPNVREHIESGAEVIPVEVDGERINTVLEASPRLREIILASGALNTV